MAVTETPPREQTFPLGVSRPPLDVMGLASPEGVFGVSRICFRP